MPYPDWVMKYKTKGLYVNKVNDHTYRLYRGHSQRIPGTQKVKRIVDEYIGTITKEDGLMRTKPKIKGPVRVLRYGYSSIAYQIFYRCTEQLRKRLPDSGDEAFVWAVLLQQYGPQGVSYYRYDWLSVRFAHLSFTDEQLYQEAVRMVPMIEDKLEKHFGADTAMMLEFAREIYRVHVNGQWVTSEIELEARRAAERYGIVWEV